MTIDSPSFCSSCLICAKLVVHPKVRLKLNNCNLPTTRPASLLLSKRKTQIKKTVIPAPVTKRQILAFAHCVSKFFELFNSPPDNTFEKDFNEFFKFTPLSSRCPVCEDCQNRIRLISKVMARIESLQLQLIKLKQSVEKDLSAQISSTSRSSCNALNNKMKFIVDSGGKARSFRENLRKKLQIHLTGGNANEADAVDSTVLHEINGYNTSTDPILFDGAGADIEAQCALNNDEDLNLYSDDFDVKPYPEHEKNENNIIEEIEDIPPEWGYETELADDTENEFRDSTESTHTHIYASVEIEGTTLTLSNLKKPVLIDTSLKEQDSDEMRFSTQYSLISEAEPEDAQTCSAANKSDTKFAKKRKKQPRAQHKEMEKSKGCRNVIKCTIVNLVKDESIGKVLDQFILDAHLKQPHQKLRPSLLNDENYVGVHAEDVHSEPILFAETDLETQCGLTAEDLDYNFDNEFLDVTPDSDLDESNIEDVNSRREIQLKQDDTSKINVHTESESSSIANTDRFTSVEIEGETSANSSDNLEGQIIMDSALKLPDLGDVQFSDKLNLICEAEPNIKHTESTSTISIKKTRLPKYNRFSVPKVRLLQCPFNDPVKGQCKIRVMNQDRLDVHINRWHKNNPIQEPKRRQLKCTFVDPVKGQCKIRVKDQDRLDAHINRWHKTEPRLDTEITDSTCVKITRRRKHDRFNSVPKVEPLLCTFVDPVKGACKIRFRNQARLDAHVNRFHKNNSIQEPNTKCVQKIGRRRVKDDPFGDHMERRKQLKCTFVDPVKGQCKITVMDQDRLDAHINRFHKSIPASESYKCSLCPFTAGHIKHLRYHRKIHAGIKDVTCEICGKSFRSEENLVRHRRSKHGEPFPFQCDICKKGFNSPFELRMHNYNNHGDGNYAYRCSVCDAGYYVKQHLDFHMVKHAEPTFHCDICSKPFWNKGTLKVHKRIHTGIRPFVCDVCDWKFYTQNKLDSHRSVHTNKRPFLCQECGFSCRLKNLLVSHLKVHENNKKLAEQGIQKQPRLAKPRNRRLKIFVPPPLLTIPSSTQTYTETETQQFESENVKD